METKKKATIEELFSGAWKIFSKNIGMLIAIVLIGTFAVLVASIPILLAIFFFISSKNHNPTIIAGGVFFVVLGFALAIVAGIIYNVALIEGIKLGFDAKKIKLGNVLNKGLEKFWAVFWTGLLSGLIILAGIILLIIPGIVAGIYLTFVFFVVIIEGKSGGEALRRSYEIVKGNFWWVFLITLITSFLSGLISQIPLAGLLAAPFFTAVSFMLYKNLARSNKDLAKA